MVEQMLKSRWGWILAVLLLASCGSPELGDDIVLDPLDATSEVLVDGLVQPFALAVLGEDEFLVTERVSGLFYFSNGELTALDAAPEVNIFDARGSIVGGVMDVTLHPDFATNGWVYITYLDEMTILSVARFNFSERVIEDIEVIFESERDSIGSVIAWPDSEHFLLTQGSTDVAAGQDLSHDGGTIHRLTADGRIPDDNPVFDGADSPTSIWSYGHRVNQGLFIEDGVAYATEHGDRAGDEFNIIERGGNYGFPNITSGRFRDANPPAGDPALLANAIDPIATWPTVTLAPTGLVRVRESSFPNLEGRFLFGGLVAQDLISFDIDTGQTAIILENVGRVRDVDVLPGGGLIVAVEAPLDGPPNGEVLRLSPAS